MTPLSADELDTLAAVNAGATPGKRFIDPASDAETTAVSTDEYCGLCIIQHDDERPFQIGDAAQIAALDRDCVDRLIAWCREANRLAAELATLRAALVGVRPEHLNAIAKLLPAEPEQRQERLRTHGDCPCAQCVADRKDLADLGVT